MSRRGTSTPLRGFLSILLGSWAAGGLGAQEDPEDTAPAAGGRLVLPGLQSLEIGGEYRLRFQDRINYSLNSATKIDDDLFGQRVRLHIDARVNDWLSVFIQFQDVRLWGEEQNTAEASADAFDLHQGFVELDELLSGNLRVGRQILSYGDERLIGERDWINQGQSFDGFRWRWESAGAWSIDLIATQVQERLTPAVFDDAFFGGIYSTLEYSEEGLLDLYVLHVTDEETAAGGNENRTTIGARCVHLLGPVEVGVEAATQFGDVDDRHIPIGRTLGIYARALWQAEGGYRPFLRGEFNYASGDDPDTADNERFNDLFAAVHAPLGLMDFAFWENVRHFSVQTGFHPHPDGRLLLAWHVFDAVEADVFEGAASPPGFYPGDPNHSKDIGNEIDLLYSHDFDVLPARANVQIGYGMFIPGQGAIDAAGDDEWAHFVYVQGGVKF